MFNFVTAICEHSDRDICPLRLLWRSSRDDLCEKFEGIFEVTFLGKGGDLILLKLPLKVLFILVLCGHIQVVEKLSELHSWFVGVVRVPVRGHCECVEVNLNQLNRVWINDCEVQDSWTILQANALLLEKVSNSIMVVNISEDNGTEDSVKNLEGLAAFDYGIDIGIKNFFAERCIDLFSNKVFQS